MDFAMLPPEINSGRMYAGPGSGPMLAAAAAWDGLATELSTTAASYESVILELTNAWRGPASTAMAAAASPYAAWMHTTAARAEQTAARAKAAVSAYESAFAMTVPPAVVAANRAQLMALIATNIFGQNTPAIAATEAVYAEMWAQDAAAMYGYAGSSAAASELPPFIPPRPVASADGLSSQAITAGQAAATSAGNHAQTAMSSLSAVPTTLQSLTSPGAALTPALGIDPAVALALTGVGVDLIGTGIVDSAGSFIIDPAGLGIDLLGVQDIEAAESALPRLGAGLSSFSAPMSGGMGNAASVGGLSVPQSWTVAAPPAIRPVAMVSEAAGAEAAAAIAAGESEIPFTEMALAGMAGRAVAGSLNRGRREKAAAAPRNRVKPPQKLPSAPITSIAAELRELAELRDAGILTDDEFTEQKRRLLDQ